MAPIGLSVRPFAALIYSALGIWLCGAWGVDALGAEGAAFPAKEWETTTPEHAGLDEAKLRQARDYALTGEGSGMIVRGGKAVMSWGDTRQRYDLKSTTKSFGATALGVAIADGKVCLEDKAADLHPSIGVPPDENRDTGWLKEITLLHLATQTAGFEKPGGYGRLLFQPGTKWHYSDAGPNWLAECLTLRYRRDLRDVMFDRVFTPLGIAADDLTWRNNQYRPHAIDGIPNREFGAGIHANVDAMARVGHLYLRRGRWGAKQILPPDFIEAARQPPSWLLALPEHETKSEHGDASKHYGLLWWNNADGALPPPVPRDAYWSWGLYDSLIVVIPSLDLVVARAGKSWARKTGAAHYDVLRPFLEPICAAVTDRPQAQGVRVRRIEWDPPHTIVRRAKGSDNWPMTWAADGHLYTAYGDGWGFEPRVEKKLSLGLARIKGTPDNFVGENIHSENAEDVGDGPRGRKASGLLAANFQLYLLARNVGNAQLAWSGDEGRTWDWADWRFETSFGCPTFLNAGQNYAEARDHYVYIYSPDSDDAYTPADRFVLARVPLDKILRRAWYEFFQGFDARGNPLWTEDEARRGAVLNRPGQCSRSGVTWVPGLRRYLWVMTLPTGGSGDDAKRWRGLAVYEATRPWGPWACVYEADPWDVHPGDSASFPAKWIAPDGRSAYLVFAGDDSFSVRRATFVLGEK